MMRWLAIAFAATTMLLSQLDPVQAGPVLDRVKSSGTLQCGVLKEPEDYGKADIHGALVALGTDLCRAVAAAVLGGPDKVAAVVLSDENHGFAALQAGKIDLLLGASPSASSAVVYGLKFASPLFLDGEGLLVPRNAGIASFADLAGKHVCFIANTEAESTLDSEIARRKLEILPFPFEEEGEMQASLTAGRCDAVIDSVSRLAVARAGFSRKAEDFIILPDRLSVEPMAPAMSEGDPQWAALVGATIDALLLAEAGGITQRTTETVRTTEDPATRGLAGLAPGIGEATIDRGWALRAISAVGNYAELYERDCGAQSPLNLPRGPNALWNQGGLMFAHALR